MRAAPGPRFPPRRRLSAPTGSRACPHASAGFLVAGETAANKPSPRTSENLRPHARAPLGGGGGGGQRGDRSGHEPGRRRRPRPGAERVASSAEWTGSPRGGARCSWLMRWTGASSPKCLGDSTLQF